MAGYLSGFVWGGLFTAAGLAVVSELTLPGELGAKAANSTVAPVTESVAAEPASETPSEVTAEVAAPEEAATSEAAPEVAEANPEAAEPSTEEVAAAIASQTPVATDAEPAEAEAEAVSASETAPAEPEAVVAEAEPAPAPEVDLPPIVSVTAKDAKDQLAARQAELAPVVSEPVPAETAATETVSPESATTESTEALPDAGTDTAAETAVADTATTAPAENAEAAPATETAETAEAAPATTVTPEATVAATDVARAAEAAFLESATAEMGQGDRAEMAEMDTAANSKDAGTMPLVDAGRKIGDGDASEGVMRSDTAALENAVSEEAPTTVPPLETATAQPQAETLAPAKPEAEQVEVAAAPKVTNLTDSPQASSGEAPALVTPGANESQPASADPAPAAKPKVSTLPQITQTEDAPAEETTDMAVAEPQPERAGSLQPARLGNGAEGVVTGRLPKIGDDAVEKAQAEAEEMATKPAIQRFASTFENETGSPMVAVILLDNGASQDLRKQVAELPFPVAVALDPLAPDAAATAEFYRENGVELVMLATGLPKGAQASDVEVTFTTHEQSLPEVVAVMDTAQGEFQNNRPLATIVAPTIKAKGWGLITWDQGLNAADQVAERENMPKGLIFRQVDEAGTNDTGIRRNLDRAALKAGQDGATIVTGTVNDQSLRSLVTWALEGKGKSVTLAPVTATLDKPKPAEGAEEAAKETTAEN